MQKSQRTNSKNYSMPKRILTAKEAVDLRGSQMNLLIAEKASSTLSIVQKYPDTLKGNPAPEIRSKVKAKSPNQRSIIINQNIKILGPL